MRFPARLLGLTIAFLLVLFVSRVSFAQTASTSNAVLQSQQYNQQVQSTTPNTNPDVPRNLHTYTQNVMIEVMSAIGCQLAGIDPLTKSTTCLGLDQKTGKIGYVQGNGGAIGFMANMIGMLYTPPINTGSYIRDVASNFGIAKGAYAQTGVGLTSITGISGLWAVFRNIVYLFFVFIFVLIGIGIMLRVRIDPRTVMTIQNQIPKIILGLILVTLSFAIAGFLIDLMWLLIILIVNVLTAAHPQLLAALKPGTYVTPFGLSDVLGGFFGVANGTAGAIGGGIYNTFNTNTVNSMIQIPTGPGCNFLDIGCYIGQIIAVTIGWLVNQVLGIVIGAIVGTFVWIVVIVAVIIALFKLWFALIGAYLSILIDIVFAPFWIIGGLFPGAGPRIGFTAWLRDLAANLMAFPVVIGLFLIGRVFADGFTSTPNFFLPPLIGNPVGGGLGALIAFGIIMMSPNVVKMTKAAFKAPDTGFGLGAGTKSAVGIAAIPFRRTGGALFGKNAFGQPKLGSAWVGDRVGKIGQFLSGGGTELGNKEGRSPMPLFRIRNIVIGKPKTKDTTPPIKTPPTTTTDEELGHS